MARRVSKDRNGKPPTQRQLRVGEEIRHALSAILLRAEFRDSELVGRIITVTEVRVSPDLRNATAFVLPLEGEAEPMVEALQRAAAYMRGQLGKMVKLKYLPELYFIYDGSFDEATRIDRIMHSPGFSSGSDHDESETDPDTDLS